MSMTDCDGVVLERAKVVGVGVFKTGTTSFQDCPRSAGFRVTGPDGRETLAAGFKHDEVVAELLGSVAPRFDGFQHHPWFACYTQFDEAFPGSYYVLTTRTEEDWWVSMLAQFGRKRIPHLPPVFELDRVLGYKRDLVERMRQHDEGVQDYFAGRDEDLLVNDVSKGNVTGPLASFLGLEERMVTPHVNRDSSKSEGPGPIRSFRSRARRQVFKSLVG